MFQVDPATQEPDRVRDVRYMLDHIFSPKQSTRELYATTTQGLIQKLVHGFNSTVFAYGQTSSGKTHTMRGTPDEPGIIPMAVQEVFSLIEQSQDREFLLRVSYMEVCSWQTCTGNTWMRSELLTALCSGVSSCS
jgi:centromeric protein E